MIVLLFMGCREVQSQKKTLKNSLDIYLNNIDKEWHFVFKDTLDGFIFSPDRFQEHLSLDSIEIPSHIIKNFQKINNDSLEKLYEWTYKNYSPQSRNHDSVINFRINIIRLGMTKNISSFFDIYAAMISDCKYLYPPEYNIKCDPYKAYLYELHTLVLNHKTDNKFSKRNATGWESLAIRYAKNKDFKKLIYLWELRSKNGSVGATMELFTLYYKGEDKYYYEKVSNLIDTTKSMEYLQIALKKNDARAFYELAEINMTKKDSINAFKNYITSYELFLKQFAKTPNNKPPYDNLMFSQLLGKLNYSFPKETELYKKEKKIKTL
ncbi:MAG: hypothetical protein MUC49_21980 [Raineya sp.]|nr:hypothetical protein [Raineya sp.]